MHGQQELDLLRAALEADSAEKHAATAAFLTQRTTRRTASGLSEQQIRYEQEREWVEGVAKYTELAIWSLANEDSQLHTR